MTERARCPSGGGTEVRRLERRGVHDRRHRIQFFTVTETAEMLGVCTRTVRRWIDRGELIAHRFGNAVRIAEPDLRAFLAIHRGDSWGQ
jgi:excisionase family DNA binding protein